MFGPSISKMAGDRDSVTIEHLEMAPGDLTLSQALWWFDVLIYDGSARIHWLWLHQLFQGKAEGECTEDTPKVTW